MKYLLIVPFALLLLALAGCSTTLCPVAPSRPPVPANLLDPCLRPSPLQFGSFPEITQKLVETSARLSECAAKVEGLRKILSEK